jgi:hypothetical protein
MFKTLLELRRWTKRSERFKASSSRRRFPGLIEILEQREMLNAVWASPATEDHSISSLYSLSAALEKSVPVARFGSTSAGIATPVADEFQVNDFSDHSVAPQNIFQDAAGNFRVFWTDYDYSNGNSVMTRLFDGAGTPLTSQTSLLSTNGTFDTQMLPDGSFVVAVIDGGSLSVQWFTADGNADGYSQQITSDAWAQNPYVQVASDQNGNLMLAYNKGDYFAENVWAVSVSRNGIVTREPWQVNSHEESMQKYPTVSMDDAGDGVVAWFDYDQGELIGRQVSDAGVSNSVEFVVADFALADTTISSAINSSGEFLILWPGSDTVEARRYDSQGQPLTSVFGVGSADAATGYSARAAINDSGWAVIAWTQPHLDQGVYLTHSVHAQMYDPQGNAAGSEFVVPSSSDQDQFFGGTILDSSSNSTFIWGTSNSILARQFKVDPSLIFASGGPFSLNENSALDSVVGSVSATDSDGSSISYSLVDGNVSGAFAIDSINGQITVANSAALDFESNPVFNLTVQAQAANGLTATKSLQVNLLNVNETPSLSDGTLSLAENSTQGTTVGQLSGTDPDGTGLTYSIVNGNTNGAFSINSATGKIAVSNSAVLNFETTSSMTLTVQATDPGGLFKQAHVTIQLTNVNEAPTNIGLSSTSIPQHNAANAVVGNLSTVDPDAGGSFAYQLVTGSGSTDNSSFKISGNSLIIVPVTDALTKANYSVRIRSTDQGGLSVEKSFVIQVLNVNSAPTFVKGADLTVAVNAGPQAFPGWATQISAGAPSEAGQALTFQIVNNDNASLFVDGPNIDAQGNLNFTPKLNAVGMATISIALRDDGGTANNGIDTSPTQSFHISISDGSITLDPPELLNGVLHIEGSGDADVITVQEQSGVTKVLIGFGMELWQSYPTSQIQTIEVLGLGGDDKIDLSNVMVPSRLLGGSGNDYLIGGDKSDVMDGGLGDDQLNGNGGDDYLYGGEGNNSLAGGDGHDFVSFATGITYAAASQSLPAGDVDIEAMAYDKRTYFNLIHRYRDAFGMVVSENDEGRNDELGDSVQATGLALAVAAQRGDDAAVQSLLTALNDGSFAVDNGQLSLIRHPLVYDYDSAGNQLRHSPVTKDGMVGVTAGLFYAYTSDGMSSTTKTMARDLMGKYIDYFIDNRWRTIDPFPADMEGKDGDYFANVYNEGGQTPVTDTDKSQNRVKYKGEDGYILSPNDRYGLQAVASKMGFVTSTWNVWGGFLTTVGADVISGVSDDVANWVGARFDDFLKSLSFNHTYSFRLINNQSWSQIGPITLDLEISDPDRENIVTAIENIVRIYVRGVLDIVTAGTTEYGPTLFNLSDQLGQMVDKIVDRLPSWIGASTWKPLVTDALQQAMPWLGGDLFGEVIAFDLSFKFAKGTDLTGTSAKTDIAHLAFWPALVAMEAQPALVDLLQWSVNDVNGFLNGPRYVYIPDPSDPRDRPDFYQQDLYRMDMMPFAWLADGPDEVQWWLNSFRTDPRFSHIGYAWKVPHYGTDGDKGSTLKKVLEPTPDGHASGWQYDSGSTRLDYLTLQALNQGPRPVADSEIVGDWVQHWKDVVSDAAGHFADRYLTPLARLFPGNVQVKLDQSGFSFDGTLKSPYVPGSADLHGTVAPSGKITVDGNAQIPFIGSVDVHGTINSLSDFTITGSQNGRTLAGITFPTFTVTISNAGVHLTGETSIPLLGNVKLEGNIDSNGRFSISQTLKGKKIGGFTFPTVTVTLTNSGLTVDALGSLPLIGSVRLTGTITSATNFSLTTSLSKSVFGVSLSRFTLTNSGFQIAASAPLAGAMTLTGSLISPTNYSVSATLNKSLFGIALNKFTLTNSGFSIDASAPLLGSMSLTGTLTSSTNFNVSASINASKFGVSLKKLTLTNNGFEIAASAPLVGSMTLTGSIKSATNFSLSASLNLSKFGVSLTKFTLRNNGFEIAASAPIVGSMTLTGTLTSATNFNVSATLNKSTFGVSLTKFTLRNNGFEIAASAPLVGSMTLTGTLTSATRFSLSTSLNKSAFGVSLSRFTVSNTGFSIAASAPIVGSMTLTGSFNKANFSVSATLSKSVFGINLSKFTLTNSGFSISANALGLGGFSLTGVLNSPSNYSLRASLNGQGLVGGTLSTLNLSNNGVTIDAWVPYFGNVSLTLDVYSTYARLGISLNRSLAGFSVKQLYLYTYGSFWVEATAPIVGRISFSGPDLNKLSQKLTDRLPKVSFDPPRVGGATGQLGNAISTGGKSVVSKVFNGITSGAVVFFDANRNGQLDQYEGPPQPGLQSEPWTFTDNQGEFLQQVPVEFDKNGNGLLDDEDGQWVVLGGTYSATGLPAEAIRIAPATWQMITPATTLVSTLVNNHSFSINAASSLVLQALNLAVLDLSTFNPESEMKSGSANGARLYLAHAKLTDTIAQITSLFSTPAGLTPQSVSLKINEAIAQQVMTATGPLNFSDAQFISTLIRSVGQSSGIALSDALITGASTVIAATNAQVDGLSPIPGFDLMQQTERIKSVAQGTIAHALASAAAGQVTIATIVATHTGAALLAEIQGTVILPTVLVPTAVFAEATGPTGAPVEFTVAANDITGTALPVTLSVPSGTQFPIGTTTVTAFATDSLGHTQTAQFTVTVQDTTPPALNLPDTVVVEAIGPNGAIVTLPSSSASDLVDSNPDVTFDLPSGAFPMGATIVTATATDSAGNTISALVTVLVVDSAPPVIQPIANRVVEATEIGGAEVTLPGVTATDIVDSSPNVSQDLASGFFPLGTTVVTVTATDAAGNASVSTYTVTVIDSIAPVIANPGSLTIEADAPGGSRTDLLQLAATDLADPNLVITYNIGALPVGTTQVIATVTDGAGNHSSVSFSVTVIDTTAPFIQNPGNLIVEANAAGGANFTLPGLPIDELGDLNPELTYDRASGFFPIGSNIVSGTVSDASGNMSAFSFVLTVVDTTAPVMTGLQDVLVRATSSNGVDVTLPMAHVSDVEDLQPEIVYDHQSGLFPIGTTLVTVTSTDLSGNQTRATFAVTVVDPNGSSVAAAIISVGQTHLEGGAIVLTGKAVSIANLGTATGITYSWSAYKDGSATTIASGAGDDLRNFSFTPNDNGIYRVVLAITGPGGLVSQAESTFEVANVAPEASFDYSVTPGISGSVVKLTGHAHDAGGLDQLAGFTYSWNVNQDGLPFATTINQTGIFNFQPVNGHQYAVSLTVTDKDGDSSTVSQAIRTSIPVASNQTVQTTENTAASGLATATSSDGTTLTFSLVGQPTHGTVTWAADGSFTYIPAANYHGADQFQFQASNGHDVSLPATVSIIVTAVNSDPVALDGSQSTNAATVVSGQLRATDADGDTLTYSLVDGALGGLVTVNSNGTFVYTPNAGFAGNDQFTFRVADQQSESIATMSIAVAPVNHAPVAATVTLETQEDSPIGGTLTATDLDGDAVAWKVVTNPAHGHLSVDAVSGQFTYSPDLDFSGTDSFTYKANDGVLDSTPATISIQLVPVNDPPVSSNRNFQLLQSTLDGTLTATDVDSSILTYAIVANPAHGQVTLNPTTGSFTYAPDAGYVGADSFTYSAADGTRVSNIAVVSIAALTNHAPEVHPQSFSIREHAANGATVGSIVATDADPGDVLTYSITGGTGATAFSVNNTGTIQVANSALLDFHQSPILTLLIQVKDSHGATGSATMSVNLIEAAAPPTININGPSVTWINKQPAAKVLPLVTVTGSESLLGGTLSISVSVASSKKKPFDQFTFPQSATFGTSTGAKFNGAAITLGIQLNDHATNAVLQQFLSGIQFSTKGKGLKMASRSLHITLTTASGATTNVTQTINVRKT